MAHQFVNTLNAVLSFLSTALVNVHREWEQ